MKLKKWNTIQVTLAASPNTQYRCSLLTTDSASLQVCRIFRWDYVLDFYIIMLADHRHTEHEQSHGESRPRPLDGALPLPLMKQATLHRQPQHTEEKRKNKRPDTPSPVHSASLGKVRQRRKRRSKVAKAKEILAAASKRAEELSAEEKLEISITIDKQKYVCVCEFVHVSHTHNVLLQMLILQFNHTSIMVTIRFHEPSYYCAKSVQQNLMMHETKAILFL